MDKIFDVPKSTIEPTCQREEKQLVEYQSSPPPPPSLPPSFMIRHIETNVFESHLGSQESSDCWTELF